MNKLGFAIKYASQGAGNAIECNKGQWTNKVVDIRDYLKLFNGLKGTDNIVTFMSFDEGGCFLTQLRAISGRGNDFLSGWIYIPNTIETSDTDIYNAYNYVQNILSLSSISKNDIESFFSKEYSLKEVATQYVASRGQLYGVRFLGHLTLKEIIGEHRYQRYYSNYKAVFLLNKEDEVTIAKEAESLFSDLTDKEIVKTSILVPPTNASLQTLGRGTRICRIDGSDFTQPLLADVGTKIPLILSRTGFENMKFEVNVTSERQVVDLSNVKKTWMKKISASMFIVRNSKQEKIDKGVRISVNGIDICFKEGLFSEDECREALVKVSAPDYEEFEQKRNLLIDDFDITLNRKVKQVQTIVELSNGRFGEMTIESKHLPTYSPLKGYEFDHDDHGNRVLILSSWFVWKQRLWGFFAALLTIMLIIAYAAFDAWIDTHHFKFGLPPWEEDQPAQQYNSVGSTKGNDGTQNQNECQVEPEQNDSEETSLDAAIKYLDNTSTWSKPEMEKYPDLYGLFDDMNNFDLSKLVNFWHSKLSNSQKFKMVFEAANKTNRNGWNPKQGSHNPTYNKPDDEQINLTNYINWLDQDQTPKPSSNNGGFHPNVGNNGKKKNEGKSGTGNSETITNGGL